MPWNEPGKGSGNGQKDPWNKGSSQPPDLDEVFAKLQRKLRGIFGGNTGGGSNGGGSGSSFGGFGIVAIIVVMLWLLLSTPHIIDQAERGVVTRFGEYVRIAEPGLKFTWPIPVERMYKVNVSSVRSVSNDGTMLTSDENIIAVAYSVQYQVVDPMAFLFQVRNPEEVLSLSAESALREVVGANKLNFILETGRGAIGADTRKLLQGMLDRYQTGISISNFNLGDVKPPPQVKAAFDDVIKADKDRQSFINEAQAYANQVVPEARGQAARILEEAQGYKATVTAEATGSAERFELQLQAYQQAPEVTRDRLYLDAIEGVFASNRKLLLDVSSDGNIFYLPLSGGDSTNAPLPPLRSAANTTASESAAGRNNADNAARIRGREER
ncbi:MAG: FtsH protease activity modulator HflK [Gammaproteobacteria bacterium]|jgi:membrane protease subunit HflK|nr:FtsH protease activity modulator HflK [Gammaproteobacteria bacterium]